MNEPKVEIVKRTTPLNSAIAEIGKQIHDASSEPKVDQRHREAAKDIFLLELGRPDAYERIAKLLAAHFPLPPEDRIKELQASLGAIHYHSRFGPTSQAQYAARLHSIMEECERCIPELRNIKINAEVSERGPLASTNTTKKNISSHINYE